MATVTRYATSYVTGNAWTNPGNAYADDNVYATAAPAKNGTTSGQWSGFGFTSAIPSGSTINAVTVEFGYYVSTTSSIATVGSQLYSGGVAKGAEYTDTAEPTSEVTRSYAVSGLTLSDLADANLAIQVRASRGSSNTAVTFYLDFVRVAVDYSPPPVTGAVAISATGNVSGAGFRAATGQSVIAAQCAVAAAASVTGAVLGAAAIAAGGAILASGSRLVRGLATVAMASVATADGSRLVQGLATVGATSATAASGLRLVPGVAVVAANSGATATGLTSRLAVIGIAATTAVAAAGTWIGPAVAGAVHVTTGTVVRAVGSCLRLATIAISARDTLSVTGVRSHISQLSITAMGPLQARAVWRAWQ